MNRIYLMLFLILSSISAKAQQKREIVYNDKYIILNSVDKNGFKVPLDSICNESINKDFIYIDTNKLVTINASPLGFSPSLHGVSIRTYNFSNDSFENVNNLYINSEVSYLICYFEVLREEDNICFVLQDVFRENKYCFCNHIAKIDEEFINTIYEILKVLEKKSISEKLYSYPR
jgi:hypothetical protein